MTPEELANLAHLRRARDLMDREYARPLDGETPTAYRARDHSALAHVPGCVARDLTRPSCKPSRSGETPPALAA